MALVDTPLGPFSPEVQLLLACARVDLDEAQKSSLRTLTEAGPDWHLVLRLARRHRLRPFLFRHLSAVCSEEVPPEVLDRLRGFVQSNTHHALFMTHELLSLQERFCEAGVPSIPYKGPVLATMAYGDVSLRQYSDLDFLVPERHVAAAKHLLLAQGFEPCFNLTPQQENLHIRTHADLDFRRRPDGLTVELHWRILPRFFAFRVDLASMRERLQPAVVGGRPLLTLRPEDLILVLCMHGVKHAWEPFEFVSAFAELVRRQEDLDWSRLRAEARRMRAERPLFLGLFLASDLLSLYIPESLHHEAAADPSVQRLARTVLDRCFLSSSGTRRPMDNMRFLLRSREHTSDKMRVCAHQLVSVNESDWNVVHLPQHLGRALVPLYYLLRTLRLVSKYGIRRGRRARR